MDNRYKKRNNTIMKLGVCVPYRNREAHLKEFVPRVGKYL